MLKKRIMAKVELLIHRIQELFQTTQVPLPKVLSIITKLLKWHRMRLNKENPNLKASAPID